MLDGILNEKINECSSKKKSLPILALIYLLHLRLFAAFQNPLAKNHTIGFATCCFFPNQVKWQIVHCIIVAVKCLYAQTCLQVPPWNCLIGTWCSHNVGKRLELNCVDWIRMASQRMAAFGKSTSQTGCAWSLSTWVHEVLTKSQTLIVESPLHVGNWCPLRWNLMALAQSWWHYLDITSSPWCAAMIFQDWSSLTVARMGFFWMQG